MDATTITTRDELDAALILFSPDDDWRGVIDAMPLDCSAMVRHGRETVFIRFENERPTTGRRTTGLWWLVAWCETHNHPAFGGLLDAVREGRVEYQQ